MLKKNYRTTQLHHIKSYKKLRFLLFVKLRLLKVDPLKQMLEQYVYQKSAGLSKIANSKRHFGDITQRRCRPEGRTIKPRGPVPAFGRRVRLLGHGPQAERWNKFLRPLLTQRP